LESLSPQQAAKLLGASGETVRNAIAARDCSVEARDNVQGHHVSRHSESGMMGNRILPHSILIAECWSTSRCAQKQYSSVGIPSGVKTSTACDLLWCEMAADLLRPIRSDKTLRAALTGGLIGSFALFPLVWAQGWIAARRAPRLPPAQPPYHGRVSGVGIPIRVLGIGESTVSGIGLSRGDETVTAATARGLARVTGRPVIWQAYGLSGATAREGLRQIVPHIPPEPADLVVVAFCVNDVISYRSPSGFTDDLAAVVNATRNRVGDAAVVIGGIAPMASFPALRWPLGTILGWRAAALQAAADGLAQRLPKLVVERFSEPLSRDLFTSDGFHPNPHAHSLWGEKIAALALPLIGLKMCT
jgi:lysophospholipase L1-like esterase